MISPDQQSSVSSTSTATQYFNLDDSISSEFSSAVNQTGLMFMPLEQIKGIVEHLGSHQQTDVSKSLYVVCRNKMTRDFKSLLFVV